MDTRNIIREEVHQTRSDKTVRCVHGIGILWITKFEVAQQRHQCGIRHEWRDVMVKRKDGALVPKKKQLSFRKVIMKPGDIVMGIRAVAITDEWLEREKVLLDR